MAGLHRTSISARRRRRQAAPLIAWRVWTRPAIMRINVLQLDPSVMGPPIVWLASPKAAGVRGRRIVANEFGAAAEPAP